ncbi:MAG: MATE family efflux transporter, partial [Flavobacteriaceae bacterium]
MVLSKYYKEFNYNLRLSFPIIIGLLGHTIVGIVDNIMVGKLDPDNLAAVSLGNSFLFIAMSIGIGFSAAITPVVAEADSQNNSDRLKKAFTNGFLLCFFLGCFLFMFILICKPLLKLLGQPQIIVDLAIPYLDIVAFSLIPLLMFQALKQYSDGLSMTSYSMYATIFANLINILINYVLIFGKFGFPQLGIIGAAIGTLVSRIMMFIVLYLLLK